MGNDQDREVFTKALDGLHDGLLCFIVQSAGGFVKDDDVSLFVKSSGNSNTLALAAGQPDATLANECLVVVGPSFDDVGDLRLTCGSPDTIHIYLIFRLTESNVFCDGAIGQKNSLRNMGNMGLPCAVVAHGNNLSVDFKRAFGR